MLVDLLQALATPAPLDHRRLGCVTDSIRTGSRARRCRRAWAPHLAATREALHAGIAPCGHRDTAVVLGSGRLDDVPSEDLSAAFRRVVRVDAVHRVAGLAAQVCLVTDLDEVEADREGRVRERLDLLYGVRLGPPDRTWTWEIAPFGEAARDRCLLHAVAALPDWRP